MEAQLRSISRLMNPWRRIHHLTPSTMILPGVSSVSVAATPGRELGRERASLRIRGLLFVDGGKRVDEDFEREQRGGDGHQPWQRVALTAGGCNRCCADCQRAKRRSAVTADPSLRRSRCDRATLAIASGEGVWRCRLRGARNQAVRSPSRTRIVVVLPAPFHARRPWTSPVFTTRSSSLNACVEPNDSGPGRSARTSLAPAHRRCLLGSRRIPGDHEHPWPDTG